MKNKEKFKSLIESVTSSNYYDGNYGHRTADINLTLINVDEADKPNTPSDYLEFLIEFGYGELDATFYLDDGPEKYSSICGLDENSFKGIYVFGGNSSDLLYAFDAKNNWQIVEISSESEDIDVLNSSFSEFITEQLESLKRMIERRASRH